MLILISRILCVGKMRSRPAPGAYQQLKPGPREDTKSAGLGRLRGHNNNNNNNNKDFGTRTAPEVRFPTPRSFSLRNPQRRSFGKICEGGPQTKYFSRCLNLGGRRACFSDELRLRSACPLGCWLQNPPERTEGTNRKVKKMLRMRRKAGQ